jgi:DNA polymerase I-like protein with 3'-5' exonuclease and polymerase domains
MDREFRELNLDAHLVLTLYDEIVVEVREEVAEEVHGIIGDCLRDGFKQLVPDMPFEMDMRIADSWGTDLPNF